MTAVPAEAASPLEVASWAAGVGALVLVLLAGLLYQLGRIRPLRCAADSETRPHEDGGRVTVVYATVTSRTRNTQTIRTMAVVPAPPARRRLLRPGSIRSGWPATPFTWSTVDHEGGVEVPGHDAKSLEGHLEGPGLPYGAAARLMLVTSRKRPVLARIRPVA